MVNSTGGAAIVSESFHIKGVEGVTELSVRTSSIDPELLKQIEKQQALLKSAAGYSAFAGYAGEDELSHIARVTKNMRSFWNDFSRRVENTATDLPRISGFTHSSSVHLEDSPYLEAGFILKTGQESTQILNGSRGGWQLHLHTGSQGVHDRELEMVQASSLKMRKFWKALEGVQREKNSENRSTRTDLQQVSISVDVGLEDAYSGAESRSNDSLDASKKKSPASFTPLSLRQTSRLW